MPERIPPRRQGDLGELSAIDWLASQGYGIYVPLGHSPDCDIVAESQGTLLRVQVKTSTQWRNDRWEVTLCTRGGNQSWSGMVKRFTETDAIGFSFTSEMVAAGSSLRMRSRAAAGSCSAGRSTPRSRSRPGAR
jgi:hypothetical protein